MDFRVLFRTRKMCANAQFSVTNRNSHPRKDGDRGNWNSRTTMYPNRWIQRATETIVSVATTLVFTFLDSLDLLLCVLFRFVDTLVDGHPHACYCHGGGGDGDEGDEVSKTLYGRKNWLREKGLGSSAWRRGKTGSGGVQSTVRWSDCGCKSCVEWMDKGESKLYFVTREPSQVSGEKFEHCQSTSIENIVFLHGFLCSSTFWVESVFQNISERAKKNSRLFAVDLLGFGRSPKPTECLYRLKDHVEMIEKSVIEPPKLMSFHLVAHSMGCIIALAVAAKHPGFVKSITLVAPPYLPSSKEQADHTALNTLAGRKLWPPILFGSAVMSWYEHLGRCICFIICRNHKMWELGLKLLTRRNLHFMITDLTRHTHHSAWHTMHNVICGGAKLMDDYLEILNNSGIPIKIIQGDKDHVVPLECGFHLKLKAMFSELQSIPNADHISVIFGRERDFTRDLEEIWFPSAKHNQMNTML